MSKYLIERLTTVVEGMEAGLEDWPIASQIWEYRQAIARIAGLEQFNAQLQNENTHLQEESDTLRRIHAENLAILNQQLALAQADNQRLREALHYSLGAWEYDGVSDEHGSIFKEANDRCDRQLDTSALEALVQKAGEVMRERCADTVEAQHSWITNTAASALIRAQLGVMMEDLK